MAFTQEMKMSEPSRVEAIAVTVPTTIAMAWKTDHRQIVVDLSGWIGLGNIHIAPLHDPLVFAALGRGA